MKCLCPITVNPGKGKFTVFKSSDGSRRAAELCIVPCGQCIACRLNYGKFWSMRMMEELKHHDKACFATLTYDPEHLPEDNFLDKKHLQLFFKRLRKFLNPETYVEKETGLLKVKNGVRYFACGEYGDQFGRPHYHAIIYGVSPEEVDLVSKAWKQGQVKLGNVTPDSCAYVAKYMTKKLRGHALAEQLAENPDYQNEFVLMSRRPGIGGDPSPDMIRFMRDNGFVYRKGKRSSLPRYYKEKYGVHFVLDDFDYDDHINHLNNFENNDKIIRKRIDFFGRRS